MIDLELLEKLEKAATPGEWKSGTASPYSPKQKSPFDDYGADIYVDEKTSIVVGGLQDEQGGAVGVIQNADAALIVALRNAAPEMIAELRELRTRIEKAEAALKDIRDGLVSYEPEYADRHCRFTQLILNGYFEEVKT